MTRKYCPKGQHEWENEGTKNQKCIKCGIMPNWLGDFFSIRRKI